MQSIKKITWEVLPIEAPLYIKKCSKCKTGTHFYCSNKFRMNNQKKNSDVWLIYKCVECDNTFNITIHSRTKPHLIEKNIYEKYINNDADEALRLSLDKDIINKNHIQIDYDSVKYEIRSSEEVTINDMVFMDEDMMQIYISYPLNLNLKLSKVIREQLDISLNQLSHMVEQNILSINNTENWKRDKIKDHTLVTIDRNALTSFFTLHKK